MKFNAHAVAWLGSLFIVSAASAVFTGILTEDKGTRLGGFGFWSLNVYARFDSPTDRALSVTGASLYPVGGEQFYQNPLGGASEPNPALVLFDPDLQYDTFVTIGLKEQVPGLPTTALEPGSSMTASGFTGGWYTDGDAPQGLGQPIPGQSGFYVLLMQLTLENPGRPSAGVYGTFTLAWKTASTSAQFTKVEFFDSPPAPGTVALMALAGMTYSRRRR